MAILCIKKKNNYIILIDGHAVTFSQRIIINNCIFFR